MTSILSDKTMSLRALDRANLFLADVRDGIGPYLAIYLLASHQWDAASIGIAMSAMGFATVLAQTPAGALFDSSRHRRLIVAGAAGAIGLSCAMMTIFVNLYAIVFFQILMGVAAALIAPGIASMTLGLVGYRKNAARTGRNEMFNHAGNVAAAIIAGAVGHFIAREFIFYAVTIFAMLSLIFILAIRDEDIDPELARGSENDAGEPVAGGEGTGWRSILESRTLLFFALSVTLFHFANAAMLPLAGQYMAAGADSGASLYMSACIIVAQMVMVPVSKYAGVFAESWGRRPIFLIAFAALPIRGFLHTVSTDPYWIVAVQALDGIGAGIFGVVWVLIVADLTKGSGRFNTTLGVIATATSIGAALSNLVAGFVVKEAGYAGGFAFLASAAIVALLVFYFGVDETRDKSAESGAHDEPYMTPAPKAA